MRPLMLQPTTACRSRHLGCRPTKGILWQASACRIAAWLYGLQVAWPSSPSPPPPSTPTSRLGLVNHLQPAWEGNQIWLQRRNPVVYWNKSSHGACCNQGKRGATPCGPAGSGRRLDCDCDSLLVTICSMITLCSASDSHHPVSTISFGIKGTYTISPLKWDW